MDNRNQLFTPPRIEWVEPDWQRIPGWRHVTRSEWEDAAWQRRNSIEIKFNRATGRLTGLEKLKEIFGKFIPDNLIESIARDQIEFATMQIRLPPHTVNTMNIENLWEDPVRRYMMPAADDRLRVYPINHPKASRDSLHEKDMWVTPGLVHRYPWKVLLEPQFECPQFCGHCTRMDSVGASTPIIDKVKFTDPLTERLKKAAAHLRNEAPEVVDLTFSGGDPVYFPIEMLEQHVYQILDEMPHIRDIRFGSKALNNAPYQILQPKVLAGWRRIVQRAKERGVRMHFHTHVNHVNEVTPVMRKVVDELRDIGFRDIRNQGVILRGVNASAEDIMNLCYALIFHADITPYYFYICDMIPNSEHWRTSVSETQEIQMSIMGWFAGYYTPRFVCDVPFVGKRFIHQVVHYDKTYGVSWWTKNYRTADDRDDPIALERAYPFHDPIHTLPKEGQEYWQRYISAGKDPESILEEA
jgi:lysine 2,3-aminomutase